MLIILAGLVAAPGLLWVIGTAALFSGLLAGELASQARSPAASGRSARQ